jgi:response regulator RpfG family c-di-GMP phosphodiesterase
MLNDQDKMIDLWQLGVDLTQVKDLDLLMERILSTARGFVNADAGSIYIREGNMLKFEYSQNEQLSKVLPPGKKLIYHTFTLPINNETIAGFVGNKGEILNIPDVYRISEEVPYRFGKKYDEVSNYRTTSMLTVPLQTIQRGTIGVLQIINRQDENGDVVPFSADDERLIQFFANTAAVAVERAQMTRSIILRMISMAEMRDPKETGAHVNRVASYAVEIYEAYAIRRNIDPEEIKRMKDVLRLAAMLHDVGKVSISDLILKKPGRLTEEEYEVMKFHTIAGSRLFKDANSELDHVASELALNHHERWDGNGYPGYIDLETGKPLPGYDAGNGKARGKKGVEIPLTGRVVAVADVFDALCSRRSYKEAWNEDDALIEMSNQSGKMFDPELIEAFMENLDVIRALKLRFPDED